MTAIVQINFPFTDSASELRAAMLEAVPKFTGMDGLIWKIWLIDEERKEGGGIYLFASRELADAFATSDLVANLRQSRPGTDVKVFDDFREASALTGAAFG